MSILKLNTIFLFIILISNITIAQTGISYFLEKKSELPNSKIVDILETSDNNLMLLSLTSDEKYIQHQANIINYNISDNILSNNYLNIENLQDLLCLKKYNNEYKIFSNTTLNKSYKPFQLLLDKSLNIKENYEDPVVFSTLISDVIDGINYRLILYTKIGKSERYNISLHKINLENGKVEWLKKISSEQNEEADKIVIAPNGDLYILGKKYNDEVTEYVPIIYKLDNEGNKIWKKGIDVPNNFSQQSFCLTNDNYIIYICGYTKNPTGISESRVMKLKNNGEEDMSKVIDNFSANGLLKLSNGNFIIYGSEFFIDEKQIVTKAKYAIINKYLREFKTKSLDENDKPDVNLGSEIKTSSDFLIAKEISNERIALGGKVYMPNEKNSNKKNNVPLLMIINMDGSY
ncbi:MAG: hypothetical protein JEZ09_11050 [Salinivirgaceae bacterium]|nr:hypothetical protein [Salinivirgaceae bacterium]